MRRFLFAAAILTAAAVCLALRPALPPSADPPLGLDAVEALGGKAEHCALAIGMIAGGLLSLFANPVCAPASVGVIGLGLGWMVGTC